MSILLLAFDDLERWGWQCNMDCATNQFPCAFHFFERRTDHLEVMCSAMNLSRALVVDRCTEMLRRFAVRKFPHELDPSGIQLATVRVKPIAEALPIVVSPGQRLEYRIDEAAALTWNRCKHCATLLPASRMRFCDEQCRYQFKRAALASARKTPPGKLCASCGGLLPPRHIRYCSSGCYGRRPSDSESCN